MADIGILPDHAPPIPRYRTAFELADFGKKLLAWDVASQTKSAAALVLRPRIRVMCGDDIALGPGKVELLQYVAETHSLNQAAKRMEMSYMKAWLLVGVMNRTFKKPLITMERGGKKGGGATLTPLGQRVLELYRQMHEAALAAAQDPWKELRKALKTAGR